jgi:hypothetical protein
MEARVQELQTLLIKLQPETAQILNAVPSPMAAVLPLTVGLVVGAGVIYYFGVRRRAIRASLV